MEPALVFVDCMFRTAGWSGFIKKTLGIRSFGCNCLPGLGPLGPKERIENTHIHDRVGHWEFEAAPL
jgi:hypothetical protein